MSAGQGRRSEFPDPPIPADTPLLEQDAVKLRDGWVWFVLQNHMFGFAQTHWRVVREMCTKVMRETEA